MKLTEKQGAVLDFIKQYILAKGYSPTYEEIQQRFGFRSLGSVYDYIKVLEEKQLLYREGHQQKRALRPVDGTTDFVLLPLVGRVAAGSPLEAYQIYETFNVPASMLGNGEHVALEVKGDSMIDEGIHEGDTIIVRRQQSAENGQKIIALIDSCATLKRYYHRQNYIELIPGNPAYEPIVVTNEQEFEIYGILIGLYRHFT